MTRLAARPNAELVVFERRFRHAALSHPAHQDIAHAAFVQWKRSLHTHRTLIRRKRNRFWRIKTESNRHSPRDLWRSIGHLMGRGRPPPSTHVTASDFHQHFEDKVREVRSATNDSSSPTFSVASSDHRLGSFIHVSVASVLSAVKKLSHKSSVTDPFHTNILKSCIDLLAPFIAHLFNVSLTTGLVPSVWKRASITPVPKKGNVDATNVKSHRPISNLPTLSKILERLVCSQLRSYLESHDLMPRLQSAYRPGHSTETAVLKLSSDILCAMDTGKVGLLSFLDLTSAFDTVDHPILLTRLQSSFGFDGLVLKWVHSFLTERTQSVRHGSTTSDPTPVICGVPQGSVLGPLLFVLYTADLIDIAQQHDLCMHSYADDIQLYGFCNPSDKGKLSDQISLCLDAFITWFASNRLQLNFEKSEFMWCGSKQRMRTFVSDPVRFGTHFSSPVLSARCLGVHFDHEMSFRTNISKTVSSCFAMLRQIRSIRRSVSPALLSSLIVALVHSRLDYCASVLAGVPSSQLSRLQAVLNAAARLVFGCSRYSSVSSLLKRLKWLPVRDRLQVRQAAIVHSCLNGTGPAYLANELHLVSEVEGRLRLRSARRHSLVAPSVRRPTLGGRSFVNSAPRVWNDLPSTITCEASPGTFKKLLKSHFVTNYLS